MNNILWCTISGICIFSNLICRKPGLKHEIKSKILAEAEMNIGCAMTYTLIEWVKEHIEELFANYSEKTESSLELMDSLSIIEKVFQLTIFVHPHVCILFLFSYFNKLQPGVKESKETKETKERKVTLTKAQKRRQWDKMDGKGEKPRGYDWVDVIKHLSQTGPQTV